MMRTLSRLAIAGGLVVLVCLAVGVVAPRGAGRPEAAGPAVYPVAVLGNLIHTDVAIPVDAEIAARFGFLADANLPLNHPHARWLVIGWGGRSFYTETPTWADLKPMPVLRSLTRDSSVLHVEIRSRLAGDGAPMRSYNLDRAGYERLLRFVEQSFRRDGGSPVLLAGASYGPDDGFFEATGVFNMLAGCNTWTAAVLREAGLRTGWWTPLPATLRWALDLHNARADRPADQSGK